jgi:hypothetical protein
VGLENLNNTCKLRGNKVDVLNSDINRLEQRAKTPCDQGGLYITNRKFVASLISQTTYLHMQFKQCNMRKFGLVSANRTLFLLRSSNNMAARLMMISCTDTPVLHFGTTFHSIQVSSFMYGSHYFQPTLWISCTIA